MNVKLSELEAYVKDLIASLKSSSDGEKATVVALIGNLGAGKTTLTQQISKELGITETVTSPTFVIEKIYDLENQEPFGKLIHIDAYRLEDSRELVNLGWNDIIADDKNIIIVEWADNVADILPIGTKTLHLSVIDDETRKII